MKRPGRAELWICAIIVIFIFVTVAERAQAGKLFTLISGMTTSSTTGTAQRVDGHYQTWTIEATCTGNINLAGTMPVTWIEGSLDGTHYYSLNSYQWTTTVAATRTYMWHFTGKPLKYVRGNWSTVPWTTVGSCNLYALGVN